MCQQNDCVVYNLKLGQFTNKRPLHSYYTVRYTPFFLDIRNGNDFGRLEINFRFDSSYLSIVKAIIVSMET